MIHCRDAEGAEKRRKIFNHDLAFAEGMSKAS
jgi:hypothetical protein